MKVLGIETSCDETAVAIVENGTHIHANLIASQSDLHALYGGVVPELASRRHSELILPLIQQTLELAGFQFKDIDLIAATHTPGLLGALLVGLNSAKSLAFGLRKPFVGVHHIEAHLYSPWMSATPCDMEALLPALGVVISGGHTLAIHMPRLGRYELLAHTLDDALGEAFDKVAVMLGFPYPGGPHIERLALSGDGQRYRFKAPYSKAHPHHFSYSGLKTQVLYAIWGPNLQSASSRKVAPHLDNQQICDLAASFQNVVIEDMASKLLHWQQACKAKSIWVGGGVSANQTMRNQLDQALPVPILWPSRALSIDNAAMIAGLGFHRYQKAGASPWSLPALPRSEIPSWS